MFVLSYEAYEKVIFYLDYNGAVNYSIDALLLQDKLEIS